MIEIRPASEFDIFENWPSHWPDKEHFANQHKVRPEQREQLHALLARRASERDMERFLGANPEVLALVTFIYSTGHHAAWIYPKAHIRAPGGVSSGLIPDYILAGANSDGVSWFLLELKSPGHKAFAKRGANVYLSPEANRGICQLLNYVDVASRSQGHLRDEMKLVGFREPHGVLLIGTEDETRDDDVRSFKAAWNRMHPKLVIRSYNSLLRVVDGKLQDFRRQWPEKFRG